MQKYWLRNCNNGKIESTKKKKEIENHWAKISLILNLINTQEIHFLRD